MAPLSLGRERIRRFLEVAAARLSGEWLLVGGAAAILWFSDERVTEDIDLIGLSGSSADRLSLMQLAASEGLPIEAVNSAADFFVQRIDGWRDHLEPLTSGEGATIYRPDATLFLLLKCGRLSETDLADCRALIAFAHAHALVLDAKRVSTALAALPPSDDQRLRQRREALARALGAPSPNP